MITPYLLAPGVLTPFPQRRRKESNPPAAVRRLTGFEDREGHQPPFASARIVGDARGGETPQRRRRPSSTAASSTYRTPNPKSMSVPSSSAMRNP